jgi:hypothetical protein
MKAIRRLHLYLGCFFAPMLLFFVATGWFQTMHPDRRKTPGEAEALMDRLRSVHADSLLPSSAAAGYSTGPFRFLVVVMSVALIVTVLLGIVLAVRLSRPKWLVWLVLACGAAVPLALLFLGQQHPE